MIKQIVYNPKKNAKIGNPVTTQCHSVNVNTVTYTELGCGLQLRRDFHIRRGNP